VLQCVAVCCRVEYLCALGFVLRGLMCCRVLQCELIRCNVLQSVAMYVAVCCSALQCVAVRCRVEMCALLALLYMIWCVGTNVGACAAVYSMYVAACCSVLQCVVELRCVLSWLRSA